MSTHDRIGRRDALVGLGVTAAGTVAAAGLVTGATGGGERGMQPAGLEPTKGRAPAVAHAPAPTPPGKRLEPASEEVRALFGPLGDGAQLSSHWRVESVHAVHAGAIPVVLSVANGARFAVEVFLDDPAGRPVARARGLALHVVNRGAGSSPTDERFGLGAMALGRALDARLAEGAPVPGGLCTQPQRAALHPDGVFDVPIA